MCKLTKFVALSVVFASASVFAADSSMPATATTSQENKMMQDCISAQLKKGTDQDQATKNCMTSLNTNGMMQQGAANTPAPANIPAPSNMPTSK